MDKEAANMIEILKAVLFGIIEGITEWLPISSTGHMILLEEFVKIQPEEFFELFEVVIQLGAIMAVVVLYFKSIWPLKKKKGKLYFDKNILDLWGKILVACVPAAIIGLLLDDWIDDHFYNSIVVSLALIIYGVIFIVLENKKIGSRKTKGINQSSSNWNLSIACLNSWNF